MKTLSLLVRLRFASLFGRMTATTRGKSKKGRSVWLPILLGLLFLYIAAVFLFMFSMIFFSLCLGLRGAGQDMSFYFAFAAAGTLLICLIGSVMTTQAELYGAKDNELLLSLPLTPLTILVSRMAMLLLVNFIFAAFVALPALLVYLFFGGPTLGGVLVFLLLFGLIPVLALAISCLVGWVIALVASRIRFKNLVTVVITVLFLGAYFFAINGLTEGMDALFEDAEAIIALLAPYLGPFFYVGRAIALLDIGALCICLAVIGAVVGLALWFLSRTYISLLTVNRGGVRYVYREKQVKLNTPLRALTFKEIRHFLASSTYMINEGLGLLFVLVLPCILLTQMGDLRPMLEEFGDVLAPILGYLPLILAAAMTFTVSMNTISAPTVSLEGKSLWIARSLPASAGDVLCAKAYAHIVIATPFYLVGSALMAVAAGMLVGIGPLDLLFLFLFPFAANCFCAFLGVTFNLLFPRFDYISEAVAVKQGAAVLLTIFSMMGASFITIGLAIGLMLLGLPAPLAYLVLLLLYALPTILLRRYLRGAGAQRFSGFSA